MKTYTDPLRRIVAVQDGAGSDRLTLECGHDIIKTHRARWPARTRCHRCRVWEGEA